VEVPRNVMVYSLGKEKNYSEPRRAVEFYRHLFRILCQEHIDICFSHMNPVFTVLGAPVLKLKGIPIVTWYAHPSLTWTLKLAHYLSDCMVASVATAYPYKHDKLIVLGQGIDTDLFTPDGAIPKKPPIILCVGRLSPVKDHPTLFRAAKLLLERGPLSFRIVIIGAPAHPRDEPYVLALHKLVRSLKLQDIVDFEPPVSMVNLPAWYRSSTVHVNLTPTGFGDKVAWESMSCARPCLVGNEGFRETLGDFANCLIFRFGDPGDLAERLQGLLSLEERDRESMGAYLRERVITMHNLDRLSARLIKLFHKIL
jgi:glycosyltransferase involved in cell wall biosynthesis